MTHGIHAPPLLCLLFRAQTLGSQPAQYDLIERVTKVRIPKTIVMSSSRWLILEPPIGEIRLRTAVSMFAPPFFEKLDLPVPEGDCRYLPPSFCVRATWARRWDSFPIVLGSRPARQNGGPPFF